MSKHLTDEAILKLWRNPDFEGSYVGAHRLKVLLKTNYDVDVSEKRLYRILNKDNIYLIHKKPKRNFLRRFYDIRYYGEVVQIDLSYMYEYNSFKFFLAAVDIFSSKVFTAPLKTRTSEEVAKSLNKIFNDFGAPVTKIESDQGKEFGKFVKQLLKQKKIVSKFKFHPNKASIVEHYLGIIKKRLFMSLRGTLTKDWVSALKQITDHMNNTPLKRLGWLKPNDINCVADSVKVFKAQREHGIPILHEPTFEDQLENQKSYENNAKNVLQEGVYCYIDFDEKLFDKSYDVSRGQLFKIKKVHGNIKPELYELTDLMNDDLPGFYYKEQLTLAKKPDYKKDYFLVEKILKEKTIRGEKFYLIKYLYYGSKFNEYVPAKNIISG